MNGFLTGALDFIVEMDPVVRTLLAGLAVMLETSALVGLVVPGDTVVLIASTGVTTAIQYFSMVVTIVAGALIGESLGFAIGRFFGPRLRQGRLGRRLGTERLAKADRFVERRGGIAVFISRFLPVFHSVVPLTAGMSKMPYKTFMAWTAPACTVWAFLYISLGSGAAGTYRELKDQVDWAGWVFIAFFAVFLALIWVVKHFLQRFADSESTESPLRERPTDSSPKSPSDDASSR